MIRLLLLFVFSLNYSNESIVIEPYRAITDRQLLIDTLNDYAHWLVSGASQEKVLSFLEQKPNLSILRVNNTPVGFVNYEIAQETFWGFPIYQYGYINGIAVDKKYQKKGYGALLLQYALQELQKDVSTIRLRVNIDNPKAVLLYKRVGFTIIGTIYENGVAQFACELHPEIAKRYQWLRYGLLATVCAGIVIVPHALLNT